MGEKDEARSYTDNEPESEWGVKARVEKVYKKRGRKPKSFYEALKANNNETRVLNKMSEALKRKERQYVKIKRDISDSD